MSLLGIDNDDPDDEDPEDPDLIGEDGTKSLLAELKSITDLANA